MIQKLILSAAFLFAVATPVLAADHVGKSFLVKVESLRDAFVGDAKLLGDDPDPKFPSCSELVDSIQVVGRVGETTSNRVVIGAKTVELEVSIKTSENGSITLELAWCRLVDTGEMVPDKTGKYERYFAKTAMQTNVTVPIDERTPLCGSVTCANKSDLTIEKEELTVTEIEEQIAWEDNLGR